MTGPIARPERWPDEGEMWAAYSPDLVRLATVLVGPDDAHDVTSVAFQRVVTRCRSGFRPDDLRAYLMRSVANAAHDLVRARQRRRRRDARAVAPDRAAGGHEAVALNVDVRAAIADLSVQQRAVVYFTYWEDLPSDEVARILGTAPATVRRHLVRARSMLRKELS